MLVGRGFSAPKAIGIDFLSPESIKTADWQVTYVDSRVTIMIVRHARERRSLSDLAFHWF